MANSLTGTVLVVDTSADFSDLTLDITKVIIEGGSDASSVIIKQGGSSGVVVYENAVGANVDEADDVRIRILAAKTPRVEVTGTGTIAYLHLR